MGSLTQRERKPPALAPVFESIEEITDMLRDILDGPDQKRQCRGYLLGVRNTQWDNQR